MREYQRLSMHSEHFQEEVILVHKAGHHYLILSNMRVPRIPPLDNRIKRREEQRNAKEKKKKQNCTAIGK